MSYSCISNPNWKSKETKGFIRTVFDDGLIKIYMKSYHLTMMSYLDQPSKYRFQSRYFANRYIQWNLVDDGNWFISEDEDGFFIGRMEEVKWPVLYSSDTDQFLY